jgi:hypothetical protein
MVDEEALRAFYEEASQGHAAHGSNQFKKPACIFCKKRKIKCDFQMPCFQCSKRGHECSYVEPKKKWTTSAEKTSPSQLAAKVDQLTAELELQKHMANYWQKQYEQKSQAKDFTPVPIQMKRPVFSGSAAALCLNVGSAVLKVSQAFFDLMSAMMPYSTSNFSPELSALFWNRLVTNSPEDLVTTTKCMNAESIAQLLLHSSIFALGSALLSEPHLSTHFYNNSNILLSITSIRNVHADSDLVSRVLLSYIFCMYYHMICGNFSSIFPLWRRAAELFLFNEQILNEDPTCCEEIVCMLALLEPEEASKTNVWAKRLESACSPSDYMTVTRFWKNIARVAIVLPKLAHFVPAHSQHLQQYWEDLQLESLLEQVRDSPHYNFYGIWVYNMKGISAVNRNMHDYAGAEMNQSIRIVTQLTKQISNTSQQIYITRNLEHFHYFVSKMQERTPESCALELMLDQIESLMAGESNFFDEESTTIYSNTNTNQLFDIYHPISVDYSTEIRSSCKV